MKNYSFTLIIAILATFSLQAQHMNIGIKGGFNLYNVVNENNNYGDPIKGFHLGLIGHFHLDNKFALQPEVVFSTQGSNDGLNSTLNLDYVNVPVLVQYMFDNGFRLFAGPQLGILINAKSYIDNAEIDRKNNFNSLDLGASLGVSYINPDSNFGIDARYNLGLTDVIVDNSGPFYNRGFQFGLFYLFNHK